MKKVLIVLLALMLVVGLVGCNSQSKIEKTWVRVGNIDCMDGFVEEYPLYGNSIHNAKVPKIKHDKSNANDPFPSSGKNYDGYVFNGDGKGYAFSNLGYEVGFDEYPAFEDVSYQVNENFIVCKEKWGGRTQISHFLIEGNLLYYYSDLDDEDVSNLKDIISQDNYYLQVYKAVE